MATPPDFTTGAVLTAAQMNGVGLWLVKTQVIGSGVATVVVTDAFSADYDNYRIILSDTSMSAGDRIKMTLNGSTGSTYRFGGWRSSYGAAVIDSEQGNNQANWTVALPGTSGRISGTIDIFSPQKAQPTSFSSAFGGPTFAMQMSGFDTNAAASVTFTLDPDGATTFTGGTIRVYGYRN
jgi:hypothetical protein